MPTLRAGGCRRRFRPCRLRGSPCPSRQSCRRPCRCCRHSPRADRSPDSSRGGCRGGGPNRQHSQSEWRRCGSHAPKQCGGSSPRCPLSGTRGFEGWWCAASSRFAASGCQWGLCHRVPVRVAPCRGGVRGSVQCLRCCRCGEGFCGGRLPARSLTLRRTRRTGGRRSRRSRGCRCRRSGRRRNGG